jgi:dihydropteroate synthase
VTGSASKADTLSLPATSPLTAEQLDVIRDHNSLPWQQPVAAAAVIKTDGLSDGNAVSHDNVFVVGKGKHS